MSELKAMQCEACRADAPKVSDAELPELMRQLVLVNKTLPVSAGGLMSVKRSN